MALNFPIPTSVGQVYQDPTLGNTYVCTSLGPPAQWVGSGSSTSLDGTYLRKDASNDPVTGNLLLNPTTNVSPLTLQQPELNYLWKEFHKENARLAPVLSRVNRSKGSRGYETPEHLLGSFKPTTPEEIDLDF